MTAPSCELYVNNVRVADTKTDYLAGTPTALSGLSMVWGRSDMQSQPDVGSCTFDVADPAGGGDILDVLHVGWPVEIRATVPGTTGNVVEDPGFATDPKMRTWALPADGRLNDPLMDAIAVPGHSLKWTPAAKGNQITVPPAPFDTRPGAWADMPAAQPGEHWELSLMVRPGPFFAVQWGGQQWLTEGEYDPGQFLWGTLTLPLAQSGNYQTLSNTWNVAAGPAPVRLGFWLTGWSASWADLASSAPAVTWSSSPSGSWADGNSAWLDQMQVFPPAGAERVVTVFTGRITDISTGSSGSGLEASVTCSEWTADLANNAIGDVPWVVETVKTRTTRIAGMVTVAGQHPGLVVDTRPGALRVSWVDIDSQPSLGLLADLATSADAVLWPIDRRPAPLLWMEDPDTRFALSTLALNPDTGLVEITAARPAGAVVLSACDLLNDFNYEQSVEDVITRVDLTWQEQTLDDKGQPAPTDRTVTVVDTTAQQTYGDRRMSYSTQLQSATDGTTIANRVLSRSRSVGWHATGLVWDTEISAPLDLGHSTALVELLDAGRRCGAMLTVTEMPAWVPSVAEEFSTYIEGGTYRFEGGRWILEFIASPSTMGGAQMKWNGLDPAWQWQQMDPQITWSDMRLVG